VSKDQDVVVKFITAENRAAWDMLRLPDPIAAAFVERDVNLLLRPADLGGHGAWRPRRRANMILSRPVSVRLACGLNRLQFDCGLEARKIPQN
jgi:hypothetical protein